MYMDAVPKTLFVIVSLTLFRWLLRTLRHNNGARGMISKQVSTGVYGHFGTSSVQVKGWG